MMQRSRDRLRFTMELTTEGMESHLSETAEAMATGANTEVDSQVGGDSGQTEEVQQHNHQHAPSLNAELTREITVEADANEVTKSFQRSTKRYQKLARIPGFRSGKVPEGVVRSKFQKEIRQEVLESLVTKRFQQELEQQGLRPVSQPQLTDLQLVDGQPLRFRAQFEVQPQVDLTGWETVEVAKPATELTEAEYQVELSRVLDGFATVETVEDDRDLAEGDWAEIEFKGVIQGLEVSAENGGEPVEGSEAEPIHGEAVLVEIGGANTLPAFTEALRGTKPGQEMRFEAVYPAEFGEPRLAGKTVAYDVTVKAIKKKTFPDRDAELAKQLGNFDSFEAFESNLRETAAGRKRENLVNQSKDGMLEQLIARFPFPVPETFVQQQIDARLDRGLRALAQQGMTPQQMRQLDFQRLRAAQRDQAINEVKASMILDRLAEIENVTVPAEDVERELMILSIQSREPLDALRQRLTQDGSLGRMQDQMRRERAGTAAFERLAL